MTRTFLPHVITDDSALGGKVIERSVRCMEDDTAYFIRTTTVEGDRRTFTLSGWFKFYQGEGNQDFIFMSGSDDNNMFQLSREGNEKINFEPKTGGSNDARFYTKNLFRDDDAWYHLVLKIDTTQSTASDRMAFYVNGTLIQFDPDVTATIYPSQNFEFNFGSNSTNHTIVRRNHGDYPRNGDMQVADIHYVSGYAYDATAFGFFDSQTGIWKPKKYTGSYGSAGWHLEFKDNSNNTATTLGYDSSGNGNHFTPTNISVTGTTTNDSLEDSPTNKFPTFCPLYSQMQTGGTATYSYGNLKLNTVGQLGVSGQLYPFGFSSPEFAVTSGKWYMEFTNESDVTGSATAIGIANVGLIDYESTSNPYGAHAPTSFIYTSSGEIRTNDGNLTNQASHTSGDIIGVALDLDNMKLYFHKNGTYINSGNPSTGANGYTVGTLPTGRTGGYIFSAGSNGVASIGVYCNFGQRAFSHSIPTGFKKLNTLNLPPKDDIILRPQRHFDTVLYTGNGSTQSVSGLEFKPDFVWIKERSGTSESKMFDVVRGVQKALSSSSSGAEEDQSNYLTSFHDHGFVVGNDGAVNENSQTYVAWCWKAGGAAVTNNDGSITTQVSANQDAGFSIVTYTGNGTNGATIGHGLGKAPVMRIGKARELGSVGSAGPHWSINHQNLNNGMNGGSDAGTIFLNLTQAQENNNHGAIGAVSSTTATLSDGSSGSVPRAHVNESGETYVQYFWTEVPGYSKFGIYKADSRTDGPYVHTGFRPAFIWLLRTSGENGVIFDVKREPLNYLGLNGRLYASVNNAQSSTVLDGDIHAHGFKLRATTGEINSGTNEYIFMAFADQPSGLPYDTLSNIYP